MIHVRLSVVAVLSLLLLAIPMLPGSLFASLVPVVHGQPAPTEAWYPAGPASNTLQATVLGSQASEFAALTSPVPSIDAMDLPLTAAQVPTCSASHDLFLGGVTSPGQFCYTSYWRRVINSPVVGTPNFFTWLDAYSNGSCLARLCTLPPLPDSPPLTTPSAGSFRQGFAASPSSLNPYVASPSLPQNFYILDNIYDHLYRPNPMDPTGSQLLNWMVVSSGLVSPLTYVPPPGTIMTLRNFLRNDIYFHDDSRLTAFDIAYSYATLIANGASQLTPELTCPSITCVVTGITVLANLEFDINLSVSSLSIAQLASIGSLTILPGHIWSTQASNWQTSCTTTPLPEIIPITGPFTPCMTAKPSFVQTTFDPVTNGILVGSGPWTCQNTGVVTSQPVGTLGQGCSSSDTQSPPTGGTFTLTRFGCDLGTSSCVEPAASLDVYFRAAGNLALYIWSQMNGDPTHDFLTFGVVAACATPKPLGWPGCTHWQEGMGVPKGPSVVGIIQVGIESRFYGNAWVLIPTNQLTWNSLIGIAQSASGTPPGLSDNVGGILLYERTSATLTPAHTMNPATDSTGTFAIAGCFFTVDHPLGNSALAYPNGGAYDC